MAGLTNTNSYSKGRKWNSSYKGQAILKKSTILTLPGKYRPEKTKTKYYLISSAILSTTGTTRQIWMGKDWEKLSTSRLAINGGWRHSWKLFQDGFPFWSKPFLLTSWAKNRYFVMIICFFNLFLTVSLSICKVLICCLRLVNLGSHSCYVEIVPCKVILIIPVIDLQFSLTCHSFRESYWWEFAIGRLGRQHWNLWHYKRNRRRVSFILYLLNQVSAL